MTAVLTGLQAHVAHLGLEAADWTVVADNVLVLVRIDHEEPYWTKDTAKHLCAEGISVEITPRLREAMDEEWTWANYPMPWCTRSEIREVSDQAQKIHDDIRHGQLLIHAHAHDGHTTVAVGTYLHRGGKSVYLHGEDHLRQIADTFDSPAQAMLAFEKVHGAEMRPGPAPLTDTECTAAEARTPLAHAAADPEPARPEPETVPAYLADAGDHDALLDAFIDSHSEWEKWRTWSDATTHAIHESQTLRIERVHETPAHETAWTVAAYETPVSDRMWVLTRPAPPLPQCWRGCWTTSPMATAGTRPSVPRWTRKWSPRPRSPSPTPDGSTPWTGDGSAGRPPPGTRASSSTPSPPSTRASTGHLDRLGRPRS
ncbi:hypothetical protein [Streptomyces sp. NPDC001137]|uniref:hypothetical protein n=1 Tax=Streptomyces sp. NPDC001137 TaxID=3154378 RepID=UPI00331F969B